MKRIDILGFDFEFGACTSVNDESIYLCFGREDRKLCHVGAAPVGRFSKTTESQFDHHGTRIAASEGDDLGSTLFVYLYLDFLLAVSQGRGRGHKEVEKYEFATMSWVSLGEYPFVMVQTTVLLLS